MGATIGNSMDKMWRYWMTALCLLCTLPAFHAQVVGVDTSPLVALRSCIPDIGRVCLSANQTDLAALSECLQSHLNDLSASCASVLENFIQQEAEHGAIDPEVADQETRESESQIEAEDQICDAKLLQVARPSKAIPPLHTFA